METEFWADKWQRNEIGFHMAEANPALVAHFDTLALPQGARVFLPLCGKTLDIAWLLQNGYCVAGAELIETAIVQLFDELGITPEISSIGKLTRYSGPSIDIFVGDIFDLTADMLGPVDAVYDRAALVALPEEMRRRYTKHLAAITGNAPQLLICFEYDQSQIAGPPFSVSRDEVTTHYADILDLTEIAASDLPGGIKGQVAAEHIVWHLAPK